MRLVCDWVCDCPLSLPPRLELPLPGAFLRPAICSPAPSQAPVSPLLLPRPPAPAVMREVSDSGARGREFAIAWVGVSPPSVKSPSLAPDASVATVMMARTGGRCAARGRPGVETGVRPFARLPVRPAVRRAPPPAARLPPRLAHILAPAPAPAPARLPRETPPPRLRSDFEPFCAHQPRVGNGAELGSSGSPNESRSSATALARAFVCPCVSAARGPALCHALPSSKVAGDCSGQVGGLRGW